MSQIALTLASRKPSIPTSSVSLTLNAKGDVQIQVDVTDHDPDAAAAKAKDLFSALLLEYPRDTNGTTKT
jgi:hypothetical protein